MPHCAQCGKLMQGKFCSECGWTASQGTPPSGTSQTGNTQGPQSPGFVNATGSGSTGVHYGDNFYGPRSDQAPPTQADGEHPWGRTNFVRAAFIVSLIASIVQVTGIPSLGSLDYAGLIEHFRDGLFSGAPVDNTSMYFFFGTAVICLSSSGFPATLKHRGYVYAGHGKIFRTKADGRLYRTSITGSCRAAQCDGKLRLRRTVVGHEVTQVEDQNGQYRDKKVPVKRERLVCLRNSDHKVPFDPVRLID
jgi:hypothetical protein